MTDVEAVRAVFPRHTMKRLARILNLPLDTARHYLYRKCTLSAARRRELALALLAQMDSEDRDRAALRNNLIKMVGTDEAPRSRRRLAVEEKWVSSPSPKTTDIRSKVAAPASRKGPA